MPPKGGYPAPEGAEAAILEYLYAYKEGRIKIEDKLLHQVLDVIETDNRNISFKYTHLLPRITSMLPSVSAAITDKADRTPTSLHHAFCRVMKAMLDIPSLQVERLVQLLSDPDVNEVAHASTAYAVQFLILFRLVPEETKVDMARIAAALTKEMNQDNTTSYDNEVTSAGAAFVMFTAGFRYYEKILQSKSLQVQPNKEHAREQALGKADRQTKIYEAREEQKRHKTEKKKFERPSNTVVDGSQGRNTVMPRDEGGEVMQTWEIANARHNEDENSEDEDIVVRKRKRREPTSFVKRQDSMSECAHEQETNVDIALVACSTGRKIGLGPGDTIGHWKGDGAREKHVFPAATNESKYVVTADSKNEKSNIMTVVSQPRTSPGVVEFQNLAESTQTWDYCHGPRAMTPDLLQSTQLWDSRIDPLPEVPEEGAPIDLSGLECLLSPRPQTLLFIPDSQDSEASQGNFQPMDTLPRLRYTQQTEGERRMEIPDSEDDEDDVWS